MSVSGAVGALDKGAVQNAVSSLNGDVTSCVEKGQRRLPFLEGELEARLGEASHRLARGSTLYLDASIPHALKNTGRRTATCLSVVTPPVL